MTMVALRRQTRGNIQGFSLVAAIFVILVLAALGAFAVRIGVAQQQTATLDLLVAQAQAAADSGIEYAATRAFKGAAPGNCPAAATTFALSAVGLQGFKVTVTCAATARTLYSVAYPSGRLRNVYVLTSVAQRGTYGTPDYVSRKVTRTLNDPLP